MDRGMTFDIRVQNVLEKKTRSDGPWCGHYGLKTLVWQTEVYHWSYWIPYGLW